MEMRVKEVRLWASTCYNLYCNKPGTKGQLLYNACIRYLEELRSQRYKWLPGTAGGGSRELLCLETEFPLEKMGNTFVVWFGFLFFSDRVPHCCGVG